MLDKSKWSPPKYPRLPERMPRAGPQHAPTHSLPLEGPRKQSPVLGAPLPATGRAGERGGCGLCLFRGGGRGQTTLAWGWVPCGSQLSPFYGHL